MFTTSPGKEKDALALGAELADHPVRMAMLERQRAVVLDRIAQLHSDLAVVDARIGQYRDLIARGLDCEDEIVNT